MKKLTYLIIALVLLLSLVAGPLVARCHADPPAHAGNGHPPDHARRGKAVKADPDDNGKGPDRGDGTSDLEDWNNGCGNDEDRDDDNEGWCGGKPHHVPVIPPPEKRPVAPVHHNCTVRLYGRTPEVFENIDVRNPANEQYVLAESSGYLEFHGNDGTTYKVLWFDAFLGHGLSPITEFVCEGVIVLHEPTSAISNEISFR